MANLQMPGCHNEPHPALPKDPLDEVLAGEHIALTNHAVHDTTLGCRRAGRHSRSCTSSTKSHYHGWSRLVQVPLSPSSLTSLTPRTVDLSGLSVSARSPGHGDDRGGGEQHAGTAWASFGPHRA